MMDSSLRPYFSPNSTQLEVDSALFSRALEANDAQVSKKILVDMSMNPAHICAPWYVLCFRLVAKTDSSQVYKSFRWNHTCRLCQ